MLQATEDKRKEKRRQKVLPKTACLGVSWRRFVFNSISSFNRLIACRAMSIFTAVYLSFMHPSLRVLAD